jgi:hypothetical protein
MSSTTNESNDQESASPFSLSGLPQESGTVDTDNQGVSESNQESDDEAGDQKKNGKKYAGVFDTEEDLEKGYKNAVAELTRMKQQGKAGVKSDSRQSEPEEDLVPVDSEEEDEEQDLTDEDEEDEEDDDKADKGKRESNLLRQQPAQAPAPGKTVIITAKPEEIPEPPVHPNFRADKPVITNKRYVHNGQETDLYYDDAGVPVRNDEYWVRRYQQLLTASDDDEIRAKLMWETERKNYDRDYTEFRRTKEQELRDWEDKVGKVHEKNQTATVNSVHSVLMHGLTALIPESGAKEAAKELFRNAGSIIERRVADGSISKIDAKRPELVTIMVGQAVAEMLENGTFRSFLLKHSGKKPSSAKAVAQKTGTQNGQHPNSDSGSKAERGKNQEEGTGVSVQRNGGGGRAAQAPAPEPMSAGQKFTYKGEKDRITPQDVAIAESFSRVRGRVYTPQEIAKRRIEQKLEDKRSNNG